MNTKPQASGRGGFTLVEILIVITVIGILAAILFPVFASVRERARTTACASNLRQIGLAFQQYAQDYDRRLPIVVDGDFGVGKTGGWTFYSAKGTTKTDDLGTMAKFEPQKGTLFPYTKNAQLYVCPTDDEGQEIGQSYAVNSCAFIEDPDKPAGDYRKGKSDTRFRDATQWMLVGEEARNPNFLAETSTDDGYLNLRGKDKDGNPESDLYINTFSSRHSEGGNILFLDGHVKWYTIANVEEQKFQIGGPNNPKPLADGCPVGIA